MLEAIQRDRIQVTWISFLNGALSLCKSDFGRTLRKMQNICMIFVHMRRVQTYTASTHYEATNIL